MNKIIEREVALEDINETYQVIDIRDPEYFIGWKNKHGHSGHIKNAIDFPSTWLDYIKDDKVLEKELRRRNIDKNKTTILYSDNDVTIEDFHKFLNIGFHKLYTLKGGLNSYSRNELHLSRLENYAMYVSPRWLEALINGEKVEHYDGKDYVIVELSLPHESNEYASGHIKGAINVDTDTINHIAGPRQIERYQDIELEKQIKFWGFPCDFKIQKTIESMGINKDTMVILYASEEATTAANRCAFIMDYAGVKDIRLVNGGKKLWKLEGRGLEKEIYTNEVRPFGAKVPQNPKIVISYERELELIEDKDAVIASVRSLDEYYGKTSGYTYIDELGDIKNSHFAHAGSDPYHMEDYRNIDNTLFNYELCEKRWLEWGIKRDKMISFHCGTGWRASEAYYVAKAIGYKRIAVYTGGWYQWTKFPNSPIVNRQEDSDLIEV